MARTSCTRCNGPLDTSHNSMCRGCLADYAREWRAKNREKARQYSREYRRQWMEDHPEKRAEYARKALYGITVEEFERLLVECDGCCMICGLPMTRGRERNGLAVDHVKDTKIVRGLLHNACNMMIGQADHDPVKLRAAAQYLEEREVGQ